MRETGSDSALAVVKNHKPNLKVENLYLQLNFLLSPFYDDGNGEKITLVFRADAPNSMDFSFFFSNVLCKLHAPQKSIVISVQFSSENLSYAVDYVDFVCPY